MENIWTPVFTGVTTFYETVNLVRNRLVELGMEEPMSIEPYKDEIAHGESLFLAGQLDEALQEFEVPYVICEINEFGLTRMGSSEKELRDLMTGLGYDTYFMQGSHPRLNRLHAGQYVNPPHVFNLLFSRSRALREASTV